MDPLVSLTLGRISGVFLELHFLSCGVYQGRKDRVGIQGEEG